MGQQGTQGFLVDEGLPVSLLGSVYFFHLVHAVDAGVVLLLIYLEEVGLGVGYHQGAGVAKAKVEVLGQLGVHPGTLGVKLGLEGAGVGIVAGVNDAAVALGGSDADVHAPL